MARSHIKRFAKYCLFLSVFIHFSCISNFEPYPSDTAATGLTDINGTWETPWGRMVIKQSGNTATGTYDINDGKIFGSISNNVLEGYWTQNTGHQECSEPKYDSDSWGRIKFVFDTDKKFSGKWGYCDKELSREWPGEKLESISLKEEQNSTYSIISGTWVTDWGEMVIEQSGNNITGTYETFDGKVFGTIRGNVLEGHWAESSGDSQCSTQKQDSSYWGRIKFVFDTEIHFSGSWGYCNATLANTGWDGTKR